VTLRVAFATWRGQPGLTSDDALAAEALRRRGHDVRPEAWDAAVDWAAFDVVVVRSCWDYHRRPAEFVAWTRALESAGVRLLNPPAVVRWNHHKSYLRDLAARGVATVPTAWLARGEPADLARLLAERGWSEVVVKPAVSASAHETWLAWAGTAEADRTRLQALVASGDVLVQPLVPEVRTDGEWSLVFYGGRYSHALLKRPRDGDFRVQEELGGRAERREPPPRLVEDAARALAVAPAPCLYARVDGIERQERLVLMELELIEPVLYFAADATAPDRFAAALAEAASGARRSHSPSE
jgi:glutathione synthase/RimK-type ligase-like ATP-grasp enzyme